MGENNNQLVVCVLISCMNQDKSIIERTHVQSNVVVVNQCDEESIEEWDFINGSGKVCHAKFISTTERGLSASRNLALENAWGDICIFCDDDEVLIDCYEDTVVKSFCDEKDCDIIAFKLIYNRKSFGDTKCKYNRLSVTSVSSAQVAFRRDAVIETGIKFDEKLGSGSGNGGGEENKFLFQLLGKGLKAIYIPVLLAEIKSESESLWFKGYTSQYIVNEGWGYRRIFGTYLAYPLLWYHAIKHTKLYKRNFFEIIYLLHRGFLEKR